MPNHVINNLADKMGYPETEDIELGDDLLNGNGYCVILSTVIVTIYLMNAVPLLT